MENNLHSKFQDIWDSQSYIKKPYLGWGTEREREGREKGEGREGEGERGEEGREGEEEGESEEEGGRKGGRENQAELSV